MRALPPAGCALRRRLAGGPGTAAVGARPSSPPRNPPGHQGGAGPERYRVGQPRTACDGTERLMTAVRTEQTTAHSTGALWTSYRSTGDFAARGQLLDRYLGLVHHVAREI